MNVLIVDDLIEVVRSVSSGVHWQQLGVAQVFIACSVDEAKRILEAHEIALLLCDIEMPPSSGFELLEWVRAQGMTTECIFLTSHAEFDYAQRAVKLGSFDYILQPARFADIEAAVSRAMDRIEERRRREDAARYGAYWREKKVILAEACFARFLSGDGRDVQGFSEELTRLGYSFRPEEEMCPVLVQTHERAQESDADALRAYCRTLMGRTERTLLVVRSGEGCFLTLFFGGETDWKDLAAVFESIGKSWEADGRGKSPAFYIGEVIHIGELYGQWRWLEARMNDNVARYGGVFAPAQKEEISHYVYTFPDMQRWAQLLTQGECGAARREALDYLRASHDEGLVNAEFLAKFHQDFIQMFFIVAQAWKTRTHDIFYEEYPFRDFLQAYTSYTKMVDLVEFAMGYVEKRIGAPRRSESPVKQAIDYIRQNIERDLPRSEIAEAVFMNADHLSRLFKKETGLTLHDFISREKMRVAASLLLSTNLPVSLVASKVGYPNFSYFSQAFRKETGLSPNEYRSGKT